MNILLWAIGVIVACVAVICYAIVNAKIDKDLKFVDHSERFINRMVFAQICSLVAVCFSFEHMRVNASQYEMIDLITNIGLYIIFLMVALGFLFSLIFDNYKNHIEGKAPQYIGETANFDKLAKLLFKKASTYNWIKIIAFCFFLLFNYLITFHLYE